MEKTFIEKISPHAVKEMQKNGILASLTIAQAILESSFGRSELSIHANNLFGIKGDYQGAGYVVKTKEWNGKEFIEMNAKFKKYPSFLQSIEDHSVFLSKERYKAVKGETDYKKVCLEIWRAGYATDPNYPSKLINLIEKHELFKFDQLQEAKSMTKTVTLDAGHGGKDGGAGGFGISEKDVVLKLVQKTKAYLEEYEGVIVKTTRSKDQFIELEDRKKISDKNKDDLFVSFHNNAFAKESANGFETYIWSESVGAFTKTARNNIHDEIMKVLKPHGITDRGKKNAKYVVLGCVAPAVLIEFLFISNKKENDLLKQEAFLNTLAKATAQGIAKTLGLKLKAKDTPKKAGVLYRVKANGIQLAALGSTENILSLVEKEIEKGTKNISIEKV